jgi:acetyltransferase
VVRIRAMGPADENALLDAFQRLSPEARYLRFMRVVGDPNIERLRAALESFPESGFGIVAVDSSGEIAGSAVFFIGRDRTCCEFSTTVTGEYGGQGLGRALMSALIAAAKQRGLSEMEGFVLARNQPMLRLAARLGFEILPDPEDAAVRICRLRLAEA